MNGASSSSANPSGVRGACPTGWHLPSDAEWFQLTNYLISNYEDATSGNLGNKLRSCRQVNSPLGGKCATSEHPRWDYHITNYGTDDFGFSGLTGGGRYTNDNFADAGNIGSWWSSTEQIDHQSWGRTLFLHSGGLARTNMANIVGSSVRCVREVD